jgi:hypothetical protein
MSEIILAELRLRRGSCPAGLIQFDQLGPKLTRLSNAGNLLPQQARLATAIVCNPAFAIENERRPVGGGIGGPMRDRWIVRLAGARERRPGRGDPGGQIAGNFAAAGDATSIDGLEYERHIERMEGFKSAVENRRLPVERIEPYRRTDLRSLAFRERDRAQPVIRIAEERD